MPRPLDAGFTAQGRPSYTMEYVTGAAITEAAGGPYVKTPASPPPKVSTTLAS